MTIEQLRKQYASGPVQFFDGPLPYLDINTAQAAARVYLQGAHVAHFQPAGQKPVLFMSSKSYCEAGKPIRGGVPVCYPWFGPREGDPTAPMHGVARLQEWTVKEISTLPAGEVRITLELLPSDLSRKYWPAVFEVEHRIRIGRRLSMTLETRNVGSDPFTIAEALHSYFLVGDVTQISIAGLEKTQYFDKTRDMQRFTEGEAPIRIMAETDRHYFDTEKTAIIKDPSMSRRIIISKSGSKGTVVWNPWIAKAKAMADFGDDEWTGMVCVETANAGENAVSVAPRSSHQMQAVIEVESL